jgi:hypothetical protein
MPGSSLESQGKPRLNPFAFASDTSLRFILLLVFVIAADIRRWFALAATELDLGHKLSECLDGAPMVRWAVMDGTKLRECVRPFVIYDISATGVGLLLLAAVTGAIYRCYPIWEMRRLRLTPLEPAEVPELVAALHQLCRIAGLQRPHNSCGTRSIPVTLLSGSAEQGLTVWGSPALWRCCTIPTPAPFEQ